MPKRKWGGFSSANFAVRPDFGVGRENGPTASDTDPDAWLQGKQRSCGEHPEQDEPAAHQWTRLSRGDERAELRLDGDFDRNRRDRQTFTRDDAHDFDQFVALLGGEMDLLAHLVAEERFRDRRLVGDDAVLGVAIPGAQD